jgi:uncharacterized coiled-coil protein SlyX
MEKRVAELEAEVAEMRADMHKLKDIAAALAVVLGKLNPSCRAAQPAASLRTG